MSEKGNNTTIMLGRKKITAHGIQEMNTVHCIMLKAGHTIFVVDLSGGEGTATTQGSAFPPIVATGSDSS